MFTVHDIITFKVFGNESSGGGEGYDNVATDEEVAEMLEEVFGVEE